MTQPSIDLTNNSIPLANIIIEMELHGNMNWHDILIITADNVRLLHHSYKPWTSRSLSCELHQWRGSASWTSWRPTSPWWPFHTTWCTHPIHPASSHLWWRQTSKGKKKIVIIVSYFLSPLQITNKTQSCKHALGQQSNMEGFWNGVKWLRLTIVNPPLESTLTSLQTLEVRSDTL